MNNTVFILGREAELSAAELEQALRPFDGVIRHVNPEIALTEQAQALPPRFIDRLGGSVKIGRVMKAVETTNPMAQFSEWLAADNVGRWFTEERFDLGVSVYGVSNNQRQALARTALALKKKLTAAGRHVRVVTSREPQLSSVTVTRQGLLKHGHELLLAAIDGQAIAAETVEVQDYQAYALRDRGRPSADPRRGMIPPKLAQMLLNVAGIKSNDVLLDPFCGCGTVLQEAAMLGVKKMFGSDIDAAAVKSAQENIRWLFKEYPNLHVDVEITKAEAAEVTARPTTIVTEPDLGRPRHGHERPAELISESERLEKMYLNAFRRWAKILPVGGRVVMIWPVYVATHEQVFIDIDQAIAELGFERQSLLTAVSAKSLGANTPGVLEYGRDDARVRRQIRYWVRV
jgi:tRNA G10  N-methylase Trm11